MMPSVTKHGMDFNCFLSVKSILEEGLERGHFSVYTTILCDVVTAK